MNQPRTFVADNERIPGCTHVLLITTGSVASVKVPLIVEELLTVRHQSFQLRDLGFFMTGFGKVVSRCES